MKIAAFALLAVTLAAPALAADSAGQSSKPKKPHLICKHHQDTGSRMAKSVCKTAAEWAGTTVEADQNKLGTVTHD